MSVDPLGATLGILGLAGTVLDLMQYGFVAKDREELVRLQADKLRMESALFHLWTENVFLNRSRDQPDDQVQVFSPMFCGVIEGILEKIRSLFSESQRLFAEDNGSTLVPLTGVQIGQGSNSSTRLYQYLSRQGVRPQNPIRWAVRDAQKFDQLVTDIAYFRQGLWSMLPPDQERLKAQILIQSIPNQGLVTDINVRSIENLAQPAQQSSTIDTNILELVPSTLRLRQQISHPGTQKRLIRDAKYKHPMPRSMKRWATEISSEMFDLSGQQILVEWISFGQEANVSEAELDVIEFSNLLYCLEVHPNVHFARCLGYVKDYHIDGLRFGLVLHLPVLQNPSQHLTLHEAITSVKRPLPELGCRFTLALSLAQSVFQLLSSGWFHKGICSHNVLLDPLAKAKGSDYINDLTGSVLVGFEFSRLNQRSKPSRRHIETQGWDLYRHPQAVSSKWYSEEYLQRGYMAEYDIYSLGVILAELGLWRTAESLESSAKSRQSVASSPWTDEDFAPDLLRRIQSELPGLVGIRFTEVVKWCLSVEPIDAVSVAERLTEMEEYVLAELTRLTR
ncbi:prion-inhibition and propagation-domain-containing [Fusarium longipes]|uniref:Prion-inhibition and propagation-domain-containing n=1 Tax=Fusarium longipes TaxID=694270 RepID=A0A395T8H5_9HYPO|nr:prion-inhibition and propagation-domain-containing [Fusarium longipes]